MFTILTATATELVVTNDPHVFLQRARSNLLPCSKVLTKNE